MELFTHERISDHIFRIKDVLGVAMYLVVGSDRACLIDTGYGIGNVKEYVESLTDKPIFVILTHGHIDHGCGAELFDEVWMSCKDEECYHEHCNLERRVQMLKNHPLHDLISEDMLVPERKGDFKDLKDGMIFDLGKIHLEAIAVPGHTQGMTMVLIQEERTILFGDGCGVGVLLFEKYSSTVSEYRRALLRIKKDYEDKYDHIIRNHGTCTSPKELLDNVIEVCDLILAGKDDHVKIVSHGVEVIRAMKTDEHENRLDGKQGNINYLESLAR